MQYQPDFNQVQAQQIQPQLNPGQVDLGIDKVAAEFSRQERGMKQNLEQERANFQAMQRSAKTLMDRSDMDWKNYEKLADFSSTLGTQLVERQKKENKRQETEAMNKVITSGVTVDDLREFKAKENELEDLYKDSVKVSTDYLQKGGLQCW